MDAAARLAEAEAQLTAVNAAITARLTGQAVDAYSINGRSIQYAKLTDLYALRRELSKEVSGLSGVTTVGAEFGRPT